MTVICPSFAILAAGFRSCSLVHLSCYEEKITTRSLHIYGLSDEIIPSELSEKLAQDFARPTVVQHQGGHYFAATAAQKQEYVNQVRDWLQAHLEQQELRRFEINEGDFDNLENDDSDERSDDSLY